MATPLLVSLRPDHVAELTHARDHDPTPYVRERAAAILKVAAGASVRAVARAGLLRPRRRETVRAWIDRYLAEGMAGLRVQPGRGRKPAFSPPHPRRGRGASARRRPPVSAAVRAGAQPLAPG